MIAALQGHGATPSTPSVRAQYSVIKDILDREHMNTYTWWQLITGRGPAGVLRRMILGAWMQAMNQISGINVRTPWALDFPSIPYPLRIPTLKWYNGEWIRD